jgi:hypothetical protein
MMASNLKNAAAEAVRAWCKKHGRPALAVRHVYPRAYVVGRSAPLCLVVMRPWQDAEPQCQEFGRKHPLCVLHTFDPALDAGMWCATAYVLRAGCSEIVAVRFDA